MFFNCSLSKFSSDKIACDGVEYEQLQTLIGSSDYRFWLYLTGYLLLVMFSALMSGLTIGYFSLNQLHLMTLTTGGSPKEQRYARIVLPIIKRHHLLLVTLLLGNCASIVAMPILLGLITSPLNSFFISTTFVLMFGEMLPQAMFAQFGLQFGAYLSPIVYILIGIFFIICWPISKVLDCLFGKKQQNLYQRKQLKALIDLHGKSNDIEEESKSSQPTLCQNEVLIIKGALDMKDKTVMDAMVLLDDTVMISVDDKLDFSTLDRLSVGHSRIPIYEDTRENIQGILMVKNLIHLNPNDCVPISSLKKTRAFRKVPVISCCMPLYKLLRLFQTGKSHLCVVVSELPDDKSDVLTPFPDEAKVIGIITLEDVIEELIQEEIIDEREFIPDNHHNRLRIFSFQKSLKIIFTGPIFGTIVSAKILSITTFCS